MRTWMCEMFLFLLFKHFPTIDLHVSGSTGSIYYRLTENSRSYHFGDVTCHRATDKFRRSKGHSGGSKEFSTTNDLILTTRIHFDRFLYRDQKNIRFGNNGKTTWFAAALKSTGAVIDLLYAPLEKCCKFT